MLEGALRDAAVQVLDALLGLADLALDRQHVSCELMSSSRSPKPATAIEIRYLSWPSLAML